VKQDATTDEMEWDMHYLVADIARTITLCPATCCYSGTPAFSRTVYPGDVVEVEVEGLGTLTNTIVDPARTPIRDDCGAQPTESDEVCPPPRAARLGVPRSTFERNEAWGMFETLRAEAPCHWTEEHDGGSGFWAITRYDDIEKVDKDPEYASVLVNSEESKKYRHLPFSSPVSQEIFDYGRKLAAERKGGDADDLVSKLVNRMPDDGVPLSQEHYDNYFLLLVVAGNETTRQAISHSMKALMDNPDQMQWLLDNPDKYQVAVEELVRWASPVYHFRRTATKDVEIHGKQVKAGDKVVMWWPSANRDDAKFEDPWTLKLDRHPNDHVTFGKGPHTCMGANLARFEMRIMFETLLPRIAEIEQTGDIVRLRSNFINGIKKFPVRIKAKQ
jgi:cytochrome P450